MPSRIRTLWTLSMVFAAAVLIVSLHAAAGGDNPRSWQQEILAGREALVAQGQVPGPHPSFVPYASPVVRGGEPARKISVPIAGLEDLYLYVRGAPWVNCGAATWAGARLVTADGKVTVASRAAGLKILEGRHAIDVNLRSGVSGPLRIAGREFADGIHVYANSKVQIPLDGKYERFEAWIGIDDWVGPRGAVRFDVTDAAGAARIDLWRRVYEDFPQESSRRQMRWELEDRILDADWTPGDFHDLALRYARASRSRLPGGTREVPLGATSQNGDRHLAAARFQDDSRTPARSQSPFRDAVPLGKRDLPEVRKLYYRSRELNEARARAETLFAGSRRSELDDSCGAGGTPAPTSAGGTPAPQCAGTVRALRMAIDDLAGSFPQQYPQGRQFAARLDALEKSLAESLRDRPKDLAALERIERLVADFDRLQREALLANPLLDFDRLVLVRRTPHGDPRRPTGTGYGVGEYIGLPRQSSKCNPGIEEPFNWDNEIAVLEPVRPEGKLTTLYKPDRRRLITDLDLHWDADRLLFSMPGSLDKWQVFEIGADGRGLRQLTPGDQPEVHSYDACYLPNGRIAFISTAPLQGVPCNAGVIVGMMYQMDGDGKNVRQVCFEQDHDHCPAVLNDGRILYLRWDYTDTPHVWNRVLFAMNPDGTNQMEYYGSNSYWPNAVFFARAVPNHPTKIVSIVTGHHVGRVGELVLFDPAKGRQETDGVVQRIPGYGQKVEPVIEDKLTEHSWPKFLHPYPLSDKYFIVSCKPREDSLWGIYLVDVFDNMILLKELEGEVLVEPIPLKPAPRPPVIADRVDPQRNDAVVYMADVYQGPGLAGIPRGTVKGLRVFSYHFGYQKIAGIDHRVGTDGPWEVKRILGTVPVEADGSALFRIPAKTPVSVQPLDADGRAVQLMRSWMTSMPGETLSCVGCHDNRGTSPPARSTLALGRRPRAIQPWHGPARNFSFRHEVQPVLDKYCAGCHDGQPRTDGRSISDLRGEQGAYVCFKGGDPRPQVVRGVPAEQLVGRYGGIFEPSYVTLRSLVRVAGLESDLHLLPPMEFHAGTSELVQMLRRGHHGVELDAEAWDRLYTWIDLNAPDHGTWGEFVRISGKQAQRRCELRRLYGGPEDDGENLLVTPRPKVEPIVPKEPERPRMGSVSLPRRPQEAGEATRRQPAQGPATRTIDLGGGATIELVRIPAGTFVMGDADGSPDEQPLAAVKIERPFWISRLEVTNEQFARFNAKHQSRYEHRGSWIFSEEYLGWPLDRPKQPVVRVSWREAMDFCGWLSARTGARCILPSEAQWEYACRAGTETPLFYGGLDTDFSPFANPADATIRDLAYKSWGPKTPDIVPRDERFNDRALVSADVGSYRPNAWGLCDMHGNVAEWTRTAYRPYPWADDGRDDAEAAGEKVVRGGSWRDRPQRCRSAARQGYAPHQKVFNVGFRIVCEEPPPRVAKGE